MSKAFTKETDASDEDELVLPALPAGGKNYITPAGYARLRDELLDLIDNERPKVVGTLGVIGPTRMPYDRMIQIVDITSKLVSNALSHRK